MSPPKIISFGEVLWDLFPEGPRFGGAPANFACHAALLGGDVAMVSAVGDDPRGHEALRILSGHGVDIRLMQKHPLAPTGTVGVVLDRNGKPTFTIHEGSAWDHIAWSAELESRVSQADAICFGTLGQRGEISRRTIRQCVRAARAAGVMCVVDINLRPPFYDLAGIRDSMALANILKLSDDELPEVCKACGVPTDGTPEATLQRLQQSQKLDMVVMTCGSHGAILATEEDLIHQPGIPVTVRDTVGAGDSFTASFLLGLLQGASHAENLRRACEVASAVCAHTGALPGNFTSASRHGS